MGITKTWINLKSFSVDHWYVDGKQHDLYHFQLDPEILSSDDTFPNENLLNWNEKQKQAETDDNNQANNPTTSITANAVTTWIKLDGNFTDSDYEELKVDEKVKNKIVTNICKSFNTT